MKKRPSLINPLENTVVERSATKGVLLGPVVINPKYTLILL